MNDDSNLNNQGVKDEKPKKKVNILIIVLLVVVIGLAGFVAYDKVLSTASDSDDNNSNETNNNDKKDNDNNNDEEGTNNDNTPVAKIDESKPWVYDATYEYDVNPKSYTTSYGETYSLDDINIPYINLNSTAATKANAEINDLFIELADFFKNQLETYKEWWYVADYKTYSDNDVLSIVVTTIVGGTDVPWERYYTYNFDLKTGKLLTYKEIYQYAGFDSSNLSEKVEKAITDVMTDEMKSFIYPDNYPNGTNFTKYNNDSINNYKKSVTDDSIKCFLDKDKKLNIIVTLRIPAGRGNFDTAFVIE